MLDPTSLRDRLRTVPDRPKPGVTVCDITPLRQGPGIPGLADSLGFAVRAAGTPAASPPA